MSLILCKIKLRKAKGIMKRQFICVIAILSIISFNISYGELNWELERLAFPNLCRKHFLESYLMENTWLEPCCQESFNQVKSFLQFIPKKYEPHCISQYYRHLSTKELVYDGFDLDHDLNSNFQGYLCAIDNPVLISCQLMYHRIPDVLIIDTLFTNLRVQRHDHNHLPCRCLLDENGEVLEDEDEETIIDFWWDGGYFRKWNHKYFYFFKEFLTYCSHNPKCKCFWPECHRSASEISNTVYDLLSDLASRGYINHNFSEYWVAKYKNYSSESADPYGFVYLDEYYPNVHGMASSLITYCFFYSHYEKLLSEIAQFIQENQSIESSHKDIAISELNSTLETIKFDFHNLYKSCLKRHSSEEILKELGLIKLE